MPDFNGKEGKEDAKRYRSGGGMTVCAVLLFHWVFNEAATGFEVRFLLGNKERISATMLSSSSLRDNLSITASTTGLEGRKLRHLSEY